MTIANPAAGTWAVLVDGFAVPAGSTTYNYVDVFANAAFGSVSVTDGNALRPAGTTWPLPSSTRDASSFMGSMSETLELLPLLQDVFCWAMFKFEPTRIS